MSIGNTLQVLIGLIPFIVIISIGLIAWIYVLGDRLSAKDVTDILTAVAPLVFIVLIIVVLLCNLCLDVQPIEQFEDVSATTLFFADLSATEIDVCNLITRADKFIQGDVGHAGIENPSLVAQAKQAARAAVGGPLAVCTEPGLDTLDEADNRITRMEMTLKSFTGPEFVKTYNKTVPCQTESFQVQGPTLESLKNRLAAVKATIVSQQNTYLKPIDNKNAALQRGELSDCERRRGAKAGLSGVPPAA
jgi:hypothetical protein